MGVLRTACPEGPIGERQSKKSEILRVIVCQVEAGALFGVSSSIDGQAIRMSPYDRAGRPYRS